MNLSNLLIIKKVQDHQERKFLEKKTIDITKDEYKNIIKDIDDIINKLKTNFESIIIISFIDDHANETISYGSELYKRNLVYSIQYKHGTDDKDEFTKVVNNVKNRLDNISNQLRLKFDKDNKSNIYRWASKDYNIDIALSLTSNLNISTFGIDVVLDKSIHITND